MPRAQSTLTHHAICVYLIKIDWHSAQGALTSFGSAGWVVVHTSTRQGLATCHGVQETVDMHTNAQHWRRGVHQYAASGAVQEGDGGSNPWPFAHPPPGSPYCQRHRRLESPSGRRDTGLQAPDHLKCSRWSTCWGGAMLTSSRSKSSRHCFPSADRQSIQIM